MNGIAWQELIGPILGFTLCLYVPWLAFRRHRTRVAAESPDWVEEEFRKLEEPMEAGYVQGKPVGVALFFEASGTLAYDEALAVVPLDGAEALVRRSGRAARAIVRIRGLPDMPIPVEQADEAGERFHCLRLSDDYLYQGDRISLPDMRFKVASDDR